MARSGPQKVGGAIMAGQFIMDPRIKDIFGFVPSTLKLQYSKWRHFDI